MEIRHWDLSPMQIEDSFIQIEIRQLVLSLIGYNIEFFPKQKVDFIGHLPTAEIQHWVLSPTVMTLSHMKIRHWVLSSNRDTTLCPFSSRDTTLSPSPKYKLNRRYNIEFFLQIDTTLSHFSIRDTTLIPFPKNKLNWRFFLQIEIRHSVLSLIISSIDLHEVWFFLLQHICWMHDIAWIFFGLFFINNAFYECLRFVFFWRMHVKMHEICLNMNFWFCYFWRMHI